MSNVRNFLFVAMIVVAGCVTIGCGAKDAGPSATEAPPVANPNTPDSKKGGNTHAVPMGAPPGTKTGTP